MRQLLLCFFLLGWVATARAQPGTFAADSTRQALLLKSYHQRRAAHLSLLMGGGLAVVSSLGVSSALQFSRYNPSYAMWEGLMVAGLGVAAISVPLYIASYHNERKAGRELSLRLQPPPALPMDRGTPGLPAIGLCLSL